MEFKNLYKEISKLLIYDKQMFSPKYEILYFYVTLDEIEAILRYTMQIEKLKQNFEVTACVQT